MEVTKDSIIKEQIITLLHLRYNISLTSLSTEQWDIPLTSSEIGFTGFVLAHLFFEIEKIYCKSFDESILKDYGFCTINGISKAILSS
jgi:hypothetical protein